MKYSFVIPTYRDSVLTRQCLKSLRRFHPDGQVIVVDDGSPDFSFVDLVDACEKNRSELILKKENGGFAKTVNTGIKASMGDIVILVNNDIIFTKPLTDKLDEIFAMDSQIGIVGCLLEYPFGNIQHGGVQRIGKTDYFQHADAGKAMYCAREAKQSKYRIAVTGALFAINVEMIKDIGLLSEDYGMAYEDVEYCLRAWFRGWRVYYSAGISAIHAEGVTRGTNPEEKKKKGSWNAEEKSMRQYRKDIKKYNLDGMEHYINDLNNMI